MINDLIYAHIHAGADLTTSALFVLRIRQVITKVRKIYTLNQHAEYHI